MLNPVSKLPMVTAKMNNGTDYKLVKELLDYTMGAMQHPTEFKIIPIQKADDPDNVGSNIYTLQLLKASNFGTGLPEDHPRYYRHISQCFDSFAVHCKDAPKSLKDHGTIIAPVPHTYMQEASKWIRAKMAETDGDMLKITNEPFLLPDNIQSLAKYIMCMHDGGELFHDIPNEVMQKIYANTYTKPQGFNARVLQNYAAACINFLPDPFGMVRFKVDEKWGFEYRLLNSNEYQMVGTFLINMVLQDPVFEKYM